MPALTRPSILAVELGAELLVVVVCWEEVDDPGDEEDDPGDEDEAEAEELDEVLGLPVLLGIADDEALVLALKVLLVLALKMLLALLDP